ncbi:MAG: patatin-like phospholipase family protein [Phycisphaerales bacterium]|nr:MAG: patatin-like phospholipase family protein [Phycisphaerales bacterium]
MAAYRILSMDGGGIRGLFTAVLLERLAQAVPGFIDRADLLAGTSTGGIIALGLAAGLSPTDLVALYRDKAERIFDDSWLDDLRDLGGLRGADYDNKNLKKELVRVFGAHRKLRQLPRRVVVPAFDLDNEAAGGRVRHWKPKFFHNFPGRDSDGGERIVDVAMRTSAAPTYFPACHGYVDGGVVANNPSMAALAQALDATTGGRKLQDIRLLSISTGLNPTYIKGQRLDWGFAQWARPLTEIMINGAMGVPDYQCARLLGKRYHRLDPVLPRAVALDDWRKAGELIRFARSARITSAVRWLRTHF